MGFFSSKKQSSFPWSALTTVAQLDEIKDLSKENAVVIFKHSTRCSISSSAMNRVERAANDHNEDIIYYHLDLLNHRDISSEIEAQFKVIHQSPQALVIRNGECVHHSSHMEISLIDLEAHAS